MWRIKEWELQIWSWSSPVQPENATLFTISFQCLKKKDFQKLAGLWLAGEVVNHVGIYGYKAAEGLSVFQRRSCLTIIKNGGLYFFVIAMGYVSTNSKHFKGTVGIWC